MPKLTIDGREVEVPQGTNLIEAARLAGVDIPYFCYHPYLSVVGQCRICMVEIEGQPRLSIGCATPAADGMVVRSATSDRVREARSAVMEFLLANHPLDCPVCDQAGECLLQDHSVDEGTDHTHMVETRRTFPGYERRIIGPHVMQNQNRCIHCSRCIRVTREISGTAALTFKSRGNSTYIDTFDGEPFDDPFSACAADVCPVGALTVREFRFRKRAWKLRSTPSVCPGCSIGCNLFIDHHERVVYRFRPRENAAVNATWLCDHGRFLADSLNGQAVLHPRRRSGGAVTGASWSEVLPALAREIAEAATIRVVASPAMTNEALFLVRELFGVHRKADIVVPVLRGEPRRMRDGRGGWAESTDAHPNSRGARALGLATVDEEGLGRFLYGAAELTVVLDPASHPFLASAEALQLLRVGASAVAARAEHPLAGVAGTVLPLASLASEEGTFTSSTGLTQRVAPAFAPSGDAAPMWRILTSLARALGIGALGFDSPAEVFAAMAAACPAFENLSWDALAADGGAGAEEREHVG